MFRPRALLFASLLLVVAASTALAAEFTRGPVLKGNAGDVNAVAVSPDGKLLASGHRVRVARLWSLSDGKELATLTGHKLQVTAVAFSPDGRTLATGGNDHAIKLWSVPDGKEIASITSPRAVLCLAFSRDGKFLVSGVEGKTIDVWSMPDGKSGGSIRGHTGDIFSLDFSPDGTLLASASEDQTIRLWSVPDWKEVRTLRGHKDDVNSAVFTPDGALIVSGSEDETLKVWSVADGKNLRTLKGDSRDNVRGVAVSPDGKIAVAGGNKDKKVRVWSIADGQQLPSLVAHTKEVSSSAFAPYGTLVTGSNDGTVIVWTPPPERGKTQTFKSYVLGSVTTATIGSAFLVDQDGSVEEVKTNSPDGWRVEKRYSEDFVRKELLYSGRSGNTIEVSYREFRGGLAAPAFFQNVKYDLAESSVIRFQTFVIEVMKADNQSITLKIPSDR